MEKKTTKDQTKTTSTVTPKKLPRTAVDTLNDAKEASRLKSKEAQVVDRNFDNHHASSNRHK